MWYDGIIAKDTHRAAGVMTESTCHLTSIGRSEIIFLS